MRTNKPAISKFTVFSKKSLRCRQKYVIISKYLCADAGADKKHSSAGGTGDRRP